MLRQSDRKCLIANSFLVGTGENRRDFKRSFTQTGRCLGSVLNPLHTQNGTYKQMHLSTLLSHTYNGMRHIQREYESANKHVQFSVSNNSCLSHYHSHSAFKHKLLLNLSPEESLMYNSLFNKCG